MTVNKFVTLELIGERNNLRQVTLVVGMPNDSELIVAQNSAIMYRFLENIFSERKIEVRGWVLSNLENLSRTEKNEAEAVFGDKKISIIIIKKLGMITLSVESE